MEVVCLGVSHQTASVEVRERFAIPESELPKTFAELGTLPGVAESVVVSTCNRVEFYAATETPEVTSGALRQFLEQRCGTAQFWESDPFYTLAGANSINHLFRVVSGLESMIIGETEILGQVKKAYASASENGVTSRNLNKLFQRAFNVAKEVRTKTSITRGPVSVGSVAVDLAEKIFGELHPCKVMILGAGETSELTARALLSRGVRSIIVSNRSHERAVTLAAEMGGEAIRFDEWDKHFKNVDILISSTAAPRAIVTQEKLNPVIAQRPERPLFVIDLAVPRDVEPSVNDLEGVYLYDIDSLHAIARQGMETRLREVAVCEQLIARHVAEFSQWLGVPPTLKPPQPSPVFQKP
jgi:glutamyl-tRNA reductase